MLYQFEVTQEDIDKDNHSCYECPVAIAIGRKLNRKVAVDNSDLILFTEDEGGKDCQRYPIPLEVGHFIKNFDIGGSNWILIKPFTFEMELPF